MWFSNFPLPFGIRMAQVIGYCYRCCNECEIFKVTRADDNQKRTEMAANFSKLFDQEITPEEINCDGCSKPGGRLFKFAKDCSVRKRALESPNR